MSQQLNDSDVERIASRVVQKLVMWAVLIVVAVALGPVLLMALLTTGAYITSGLPAVAAVAITAAMIAVPLVALIWAWDRTR